MLAVAVFIVGFLIPVLGLIWPIAMVAFFILIPLSVQLAPSISIFGFRQSLFGALSLVSLPPLLVACSINIRNYLRPLRFFLLPVLLLTLLIILNTIISSYPMMDGVREAGGLFYLAVAGSLCFVAGRNSKFLKYVLALNFAVSLLVCFISILDFTVYKSFVRTDVYGAHRMSSFLIQNPTDLACYTLFFFSVSFAAFLSLNSVYWGALSLVYACVIIGTYSLAGIGSLIVSSITAYYFTGTYKKLWTWGLGVFLASLGSIITLGFKVYQAPIFARARHLGTGFNRFKIWHYCLELIQGKPLLGYSSAIAHTRLAKYFGSIDSAHNAYLSQLLSYGVIGFLLTGWVFCWIASKLVAKSKVDNDLISATSIGCLSFLIGLMFFGLTHSFSLNTLVVYPFWIQSMFVIALPDKENE